MPLLTGAGDFSRGNNSSGNVTMTLPANTVAGDLLILFVATSKTDSNKPGILAGWTNLATGDVNGAAYRISYKVAVDGDANASITVGTSASRSAALVVRATGLAPPVDVVGAETYQTTNATEPILGATASKRGQWVGFITTNQTATPANFTISGGPSGAAFAVGCYWSNAGSAQRTEIGVFQAEVPAGAVPDGVIAVNNGQPTRGSTRGFVFPLAATQEAHTAKGTAPTVVVATGSGSSRRTGNGAAPTSTTATGTAASRRVSGGGASTSTSALGTARSTRGVAQLAQASASADGVVRTSRALSRAAGAMVDASGTARSARLTFGTAPVVPDARQASARPVRARTGSAPIGLAATSAHVTTRDLATPAQGVRADADGLTVTIRASAGDTAVRLAVSARSAGVRAGASFAPVTVTASYKASAYEIGRDLTITVAVGADRWRLHAGADRWHLDTGADRWAMRVEAS